ncbi:MAG: DUF1566 domain-containing protein [Sulfurovum sp.]
MIDYNPNSHIMELKLNLDKDIRAIIKEINPNATIKLNNSDAKMLFGEKEKRAFYISVKARGNSLYIDSAFLVSGDIEYMIDMHKDIVYIDNLMIEDTPITQRYTHKEAEKYAKNLRLGGYNDWRLPTKDELLNIYNNKYKLKNIKDDYFWTSTTNREDSAQAWVVYFNSGNDRWSNKTLSSFVRCVR